MPQNTSQVAPTYSVLRQFIAETIQPSKKTAAFEPDGPAGSGSSHETSKLDGNLKELSTGERFAEYSADLKKKMQGNSVEQVGSLGDKQDKVQPNQGVSQFASGENRAATDPTKTTTPEIKDTKAASLATASLSELSKMAADAAEQANAVLAKIAARHTKVNPPAPQQTQQTQQTQTNKAAAAAERGYEIARALGYQKEAADQAAANTILHLQENATRRAAMVAAYCSGYFAQDEHLRKAAMADAGLVPPGGAPPMPPPGMPPGGAPPMPPPEGGELPLPEGDEAQGSGDPDADGQGGEDKEQAIQQLLMALAEMQHSPDELGAAPAATDPAVKEEASKIAAELKRYVRAGKFQIREAKSAEERQLRDVMKGYVRELIG